MKQGGKSLLIRSFIFGVEDSLVSTVGITSGIAAANVDRVTILLTGTVLIFVEAFSMGTGSFLSERSAEEYTNDKSIPLTRSIFSSVVMFVSYFIAGFIPLIPYVLAGTSIAFPISIAASLIALYLLGALSAKHFGKSVAKNGARMLVIGGLAVIVGILIGQVVHKIGK